MKKITSTLVILTVFSVGTECVAQSSKPTSFRAFVPWGSYSFGWNDNESGPLKTFDEAEAFVRAQAPRVYQYWWGRNYYMSKGLVLMLSKTQYLDNYKTDVSQWYYADKYFAGASYTTLGYSNDYCTGWPWGVDAKRFSENWAWEYSSPDTPLLSAIEPEMMSAFKSHCYERWPPAANDPVRTIIQYPIAKIIEDVTPVIDRISDKPELCGNGALSTRNGIGGFGNPIFPAMGTKRENVVFGRLAGLDFGATYDTKRKMPNNASGGGWLAGTWVPPSFGALWELSVQRKLTFEIFSAVSSVQAYRGGGYQVSFVKSGSDFKPSGDVKDRLSKRSVGGWLYYDLQADVQEFYGDDGFLQKSTKSGGGTLYYTYSTASTAPDIAPTAGLLIQVSDNFGRVVDFRYEQPTDTALKPRINKVIGTGNADITIGYDTSGNLETITWPDQTTKQFIYDDPGLPWALTGIRDETQKRISTYGYTPSGLANRTQGAGGVNSYTATWQQEPRWNVAITWQWEPSGAFYWRDITWVAPELPQITDPYDNNISITTQLVQGMVRISGQSQPAGSGCNAAFSKWDFDANANITNRVDFSGRRTCSAYDSSRNLETTRLEGLIDDPLADPALNTCPADLPSYTIPVNLAPDKAQRKTSTQWHPVWHLRTREAEPKRITTWVYNGQPDPLNNNAVASCAPADALLPDGSKIAVLCKRYEQATADETGNLGFAAPVLSTRSWSTTYNQHGQVLSETDPRQKKTCHQYWGDTAFEADGRGHTLGDLWRTSQMAGASQDCTPTNMAAQVHKTTHTHYNKRGQVLRTELPNGGVEAREYHLRGWLTKVKQWASVAAADSGAPSQDTQYEYYPTGLLKLVTQADGSWQRYEYDDAHRLTDVIDSLGNKVHYTLDNAGNATQEAHTDPTGVLVKAISRTYDTLGRLQSQKLGDSE